MKKFVPFAVVLVGVLVATAYGITEAQSTVAPALDALKFELIPSKVIGGPQTYKVTQKSVDLLTNLLKNNGTITLENDGKLTIKEGK